MSAPAAKRFLPDAELANYVISRSGTSATVRCWKLTCRGQPVVVRARTINLIDLLAKVAEHQLRHHEPAPEPTRLGLFTDRISGQPCAVVIPAGGGVAGIEHPGCATLADLSIDLDAFYCPACKMNGRVSGAWCADLIRRSATVA